VRAVSSKIVQAVARGGIEKFETKSKLQIREQKRVKLAATMEFISNGNSA